jgi:adenylate kinase family enzyme
METNNFIFFKKIIIFGAPGSGKSSLTSLFENKIFKEQSPSQFCM